MTDTDLRNRLVDHLHSTTAFPDPRVEEAMRTVPRHLFVPGATLEEAYANRAVNIKENPDPDALPLSCASQPDIVYAMLAQLNIQPGQRALEVGAGTGYNAALMQHLTGLAGEVTALDVHSDVVAHARQRLATAGYGSVRVLQRDGAAGAPEHGPYDRIIATVGVWDFPAAWWDQLAPDGRIVLPLRWRGLTRSVALVRGGDGALKSESLAVCGFLPMVGQSGELDGFVDEERTFRLYWDADQPVRPETLRKTIDDPAEHLIWTGFEVAGDEDLSPIWLRLSAADAATCRLTVKPEFLAAHRMRRPTVPALSPALVEGDSIAYVTLHRVEGSEPTRFMLGAVGYGPAGGDLAARLTEQIRAWGSARTADPVIRIYPVGTPDDELPPGHVIDKPSARMVIAYT
ncbi:methyltransferase, FxLD system [Streptomyces sp. NPDC047130]|uniref:methyltransferase, FxLD system n=1 Tax=Streptomyces sp. NPDC047130 TaxID=3155261 RepID=UPI0033D81C15